MRAIEAGASSRGLEIHHEARRAWICCVQALTKDRLKSVVAYRQQAMQALLHRAQEQRHCEQRLTRPRTACNDKVCLDAAARGAKNLLCQQFLLFSQSYAAFCECRCCPFGNVCCMARQNIKEEGTLLVGGITEDTILIRFESRRQKVFGDGLCQRRSVLRPKQWRLRG